MAERFGGHLAESDSADASADADDDLGGHSVRLDDSLPLPAGRDVLLTVLHGHVVLAELARFTDDGARRLSFAQGKVEMPNGIVSGVLLRAATWQGAQRIIQSDPGVLGGREVTVWPMSPDAPDPEGSSWAQAHAALLGELARRNPAPLECLVCGRPVSDRTGEAVEIDEAGEEQQVGLVHGRCRRPTHRVIAAIGGGLQDPIPELADFDVQTWIDVLPKGQGLFANAGPAVRGTIAEIGWKPSRAHLAVGNWGVTYEDEQGTVHYVQERQQLQRMTHPEAEAEAAQMASVIAASEQANNPVCVAEGSGAFGARSVLLRTEPGARLHRVTDVAVRELNRSTIMAHRTVDNFYAPLIALLDAETGALFGFHGAVVLLTDPLRLADALENWRAAGIDPPTLRTTIIRSDEQFDGFVAEAFGDGVGVVIDPMLAPSGEPLTGFVMRNLSAMLA